jgi:hypothetical protein
MKYDISRDKDSVTIQIHDFVSFDSMRITKKNTLSGSWLKLGSNMR